MTTLQARLQASKQNAVKATINTINDDVEARIAAKLATGKFVNTGKQYDASEAVADAMNSALRMSASVDDNGNLVWKQA